MAVPENSPGDRLSIDLIRSQLSTETCARHIYLFGEVSSTNDVVKSLARHGASGGTVVIAEAQSAARGRHGKSWFAPPNVNLYLSVLFRPAIPPAAVPVFSFIASLAMTDAVWCEGLRATIRWPNDILIAGRKMAGALVESAAPGDRLEYVILGVGSNVNVSREALAAGLGTEAPGATSLSESAGRAIDRNRFAGAFLNALDAWCHTYRTLGPAAVLTAWRERDALSSRGTMREHGDVPPPAFSER